MVTGHNDDVKYGSRVYHVQTEDKGRNNPVIETLVYVGGTGQILHKERLSYADQNTPDTYGEKIISELVDGQHHRIIGMVQNGAFDPDRRPFGEEFITPRTLDECVLDFLLEQSKEQNLELAVVSESVYTPGASAWLVVRAIRQDSSSPVAGVRIRGRLIHSEGQTVEFDERRTDPSGEVRLEFQVPIAEGNAAVIVQGESDGHGADEIRRLIC